VRPRVETTWRYQARVARLLDGPVHPLAWLAERVALRIGDAIVEHVQS
jgi:hypothetical protein